MLSPVAWTIHFTEAVKERKWDKREPAYVRLLDSADAWLPTWAAWFCLQGIGYMTSHMRGVRVAKRALHCLIS